ncbi:glycosyltransferase [Mucilaginibacter sp.]|uniref:glycosyltransferase family 2 protein n=1 Tax=Mucilaginibacter sp. TaxID=1882438 RepID=UPI002639F080|nr:glycosyltransferase [Mucilaginibacter sp.]MDB4919631.1 hypothetical protein [Mucilaginibacter sp.]
MKNNIDIIILSYAKDEYLKGLTIQTINTLLESEDPEKIRFNVVVVESNKALQPFQFENSTTIYPREGFGFHKYLNIGITLTSSPYVCLCNNDLIFHRGWATELLKAMGNDPELLSVHPCIPTFQKKEEFTGHDSEMENYFGVLFGWCIFVKREIFNIIGPLDEKLTFWYADRDYSNTLKKYGIKNCLIEKSIVTHLGSGSWNSLRDKEHRKLTQAPRIYFSYKWHHGSYLRYKVQTLIYRLTKKW